MEGFGPETFGTLYADEYDAVHDPGTTEQAVALLLELAAGRRVLELAVGTGRLALPLARRGVEVHGIEASPEMVAKLREKPGGDGMPVTLGDMTVARAEGQFGLVFLAFNTLFNLTSQSAQVQCFANAASHLDPGGHFLVETYVPDPSTFDGGSVRARRLQLGALELEAASHDPVSQTVDYQRVRITDSGIELKPLPTRYAYPPEIDLMARLAGLELESRWGSWERAPFSQVSDMHVSLYRKL